MKFYDRNGILWVDYTINKRRVRKSLGVKYSKENITNYTYSLKKELEKAPNLLSASDTSFEFFKNRVLEWTRTNRKNRTFRNYTAQFRIFERFFKILDVRKITPYDVEMCILKMQNDGLANKTIKIILGTISMAFKEAIKDGVIWNNPVKLAKKPTCKRKVYPAFSDEQIAKLLSHAEGDLKKFLYIAFYTGARAGEVLGLKWSDINFEKNVLNITRARTHTDINIIDTPKTGARSIYLLAPLKEFLSGYLSAKDNFIITCCYASILNKFQALLNELGYEKTGLHSTRRTFIRLAMKKGVDLALIQKMVGHTDLTMINNVYSGYIEEDGDSDILNRAFYG